MSISEAELSRASEALAPLRDGFAEDGADLAVGGSGDAIQVRLVLTEESCGDCIVGPDILHSIVLEQLRGAGLAAPVTVVDPRA
jgi:hypothetical protein